MTDSKVTQALQLYVNKYNIMLDNLKLALNQSVKDGKLTQAAADQYFQNFSRCAFKCFQLHVAQFEVTIQKAFIQNSKMNPAFLDQTNLMNPINMQLAMQNSNSIVSQYAAENAAAITEQTNIEAANVLTTSNSLQEEVDKLNDEAEKIITNISSTDVNTSSNSKEDMEKVATSFEKLENDGKGIMTGAIFCSAMEKLTDASEEFFNGCKDVLEKCGIKKEGLNFAEKSENKLEEAESLFKAPIPKPTKFPDDNK